MPKVTYPNQRIVQIHRDRVTSDFLGIKNENWQYAARDLGAHALLLYLYFAANADGYTIALSPAAIRQAVGMPPQTYRDQFIKLIDKKYLVQTGNNTYSFYETPQHVTQFSQTETSDGSYSTSTILQKPQAAQTETAEDIEININTIDKNKYIQQEKQVSPTVGFSF